MSLVILHHYPNCSTCKKARKWLAARDVDVQLVDIVKSPPSVAELSRLLEASGLPLRKFFNTSGQSYRKGGFKDRLKTMSEDEALEALAADGKLIKRPLLDASLFEHPSLEAGAAVVLVGFSEAAYESLLGA